MDWSNVKKIPIIAQIRNNRNGKVKGVFRTKSRFMNEARIKTINKDE